MSALADDWEDSDNDDWEAVADDLDDVNINEDSNNNNNDNNNINNNEKNSSEEVVMSTDEIFADLKEKLVIDSHNMCRAVGVATGVKLRTSKAENENKLIFLVETLKILGPQMKLEELEALKKLTSAKVKVYNAQKKAEEDRQKKAEEEKLKKENPPAKKKKKKKKKKKRVYSVYEDEDDPDLWDGLDESSERYHEALTHKSSRNFGKAIETSDNKQELRRDISYTMAEFNNDEFIATLTNLSSKQKDINEVTKFMILHYENIELQRKLWEDVFDAVEFEQRITLIYLLNDVIQSSRNSKGNLFVSAFLRPIERSFRKFQKKEAENEDSKTLKTLKRICEIWRERGCYQASQTAKFLAILSGTAPVPLDEILLPDLISRPKVEEVKKSKNPLIKALLANEKINSTESLKADRIELLKVNIIALVEQTDEEQERAVTGKFKAKTPNDLVVEEIPIDCKKSYKLIDEYIKILKNKKKKKEKLVKLLKNQLGIFTDDLLSNRPEDDLANEKNVSDQMFEGLSMTWDAISQYELLQSQHKQKQQQQNVAVAQQQHMLRPNNNNNNNNMVQPPLHPRPPNMMPPQLGGLPPQLGGLPPRPPMQARPFLPPPRIQHQQRQPSPAQPFIVGTPAEWDGTKGSAPKRQKTGQPPPLLAPLGAPPPQQFNYQQLTPGPQQQMMMQQQLPPRGMQQQQAPPRGRGRGRANNMPAWMMQQ